MSESTLRARKPTDDTKSGKGEPAVASDAASTAESGGVTMRSEEQQERSRTRANSGSKIHPASVGERWKERDPNTGELFYDDPATNYFRDTAPEISMFTSTRGDKLLGEDPGTQRRVCIFLAVFLAVLVYFTGTIIYADMTKSVTEWEFFMVTDLDFDSRHPEKFKWYSVMQAGVLHYNSSNPQPFSFSWPGKYTLKGVHSVKNRSMELSALEFFDGELLAFCDRSGLSISIDMQDFRSTSVKWILRAGDGTTQLPFKAEWAAVPDKDTLLVGSSGKEWVDERTGKVTNQVLKWVKRYSRKTGTWSHEDWTEKYDALREASNSTFPGYMIHEAAVYDDSSQKWYFFPRKVSAEPYNSVHDERRSSNIMISCDDDFSLSSVTVTEVGPLELDWGFAAVKLLPRAFQPRGSLRYFLGVKVYEVEGAVQSKVVVFDSQGRLLSDPHMVAVPGDLVDKTTLDASRIDSPLYIKPTTPPDFIDLEHLKFEGLAFVPSRGRMFVRAKLGLGPI